MRNHRLHARIEAGLSLLAGLLCLATIVVPDWIEKVFGADPDTGSGAAEWLLVAVLAVVAVGLAALSRREYRRVSASPGLR